MATFKVGQRVRIVSISRAGVGPTNYDTRFLGKEGTITAYCPDYRNVFGEHMPWEVKVDGDDLCGFAAEHLAPLTDPGCDAFLERIKQWGPLHEEPTVKREIA